MNAKEPVKFQNINILSNKIETKNNIVFAWGDVVLHSPNYLISAKRAVYDKNSSVVELFDDVNILNGISNFGKTQYAKIDLKSDQKEFFPMFIGDAKNNIWLDCKNGNFKENIYFLEKAVVSSCDISEPDWKISFTSGTYDQKKEDVELFNPVFRVGQTPVFYLPYLTFSMNKERRSGLLRPKIGQSADEGFFYLQPIYFAPQKDFDIELDPQIRTNRGAGVYSTLRFVDTYFSKGEISGGFFDEKSSYSQSQELKYDTHYGFDIFYENSSVFAKDSSNFQDGLYFDYHNLSDIDYLNLKHQDSELTSKLVTSRLNYFVNRKKDYFGLYARYFTDTSKLSNDDTLQTLPIGHYHRYEEPVFLDKLFYSLDFKVHNYERKEGVNGNLYDIAAPLTYDISLFEDYLNFSVSENLYFTKVDYSNLNENEPIENGYSFRNSHKISLYSNLAKKYGDNFHSIGGEISFLAPSYEKEEGEFEDFVEDFVSEKNFRSSLSQFFFNKDGVNFLTHRVSQSYYPARDRYKYGDFENEVEFRTNQNQSFQNTIYYSHEDERVAKIKSILTSKFEEFDLSLSHLYKDYLEKENANYFTARLESKEFSNYKLFGSVSYDFFEDFAKKWELGWTKGKRCWDYKVSFIEETKPSLTQNGADSVKNQGVYFMVNLYPLGSIDHEFAKETRINGEN